MKSIATLFLLISVSAMGQQPIPYTVVEPVTQPVLHCPVGWKVEVWHKAYCPDCAMFGVVPYGDSLNVGGSVEAGYFPYAPPIQLTASNDATDAVHPARCMKDIAAPGVTSCTTIENCMFPEANSADAANEAIHDAQKRFNQQGKIVRWEVGSRCDEQAAVFYPLPRT